LDVVAISVVVERSSLDHAATLFLRHNEIMFSSVG